MRQHLVEIIEQAREKLSLAPALEYLLQRLSHASAVFEKENRENRDQHQPNPVCQKCGYPCPEASRPSKQFVAMICQHVLDSQLGVVAPPSCGTDLPSDLPRCKFVDKSGKVRAKSTSLTEDVRSGEHQHDGNDDPKHHINFKDGNAARTSG